MDDEQANFARTMLEPIVKEFAKEIASQRAREQLKPTFN